jgi:hypothetical protein
MLAARSLFAELTRLRWIMLRMLGTPIASSTATMVIVVISSSSVKPRVRRGAGIAPLTSRRR